MVLEPIEILVRLPIDDTIRVPHHPYVVNLVNPELAMRMEKLVEKMQNMLDNLPPPKCVKSLKKALKSNSMRQNKYSVRTTKTF